jgi:16S rRNA processing protein RimM
MLDIRSDRPERRFELGAVYSPEPAVVPGQVARPGGGLAERLTLSRFQSRPGRVVAGFAEVADRTGAESLRGAKLLAEVDPDEEPDAWYPSRLRGAAVTLADGAPVGVVKGVVSAPGQDLLEIVQPDGSTALVPLVKELVPEVDPNRGRIVIDPPEGLVAARPERGENAD